MIRNTITTHLIHTHIEHKAHIHKDYVPYMIFILVNTVNIKYHFILLMKKERSNQIMQAKRLKRSEVRQNYKKPRTLV